MAELCNGANRDDTLGISAGWTHRKVAVVVELKEVHRELECELERLALVGAARGIERVRASRGPYPERDGGHDRANRDQRDPKRQREPGH